MNRTVYYCDICGEIIGLTSDKVNYVNGCVSVKKEESDFWKKEVSCNIELCDECANNLMKKLSKELKMA